MQHRSVHDLGRAVGRSIKKRPQFIQQNFRRETTIRDGQILLNRVDKTRSCMVGTLEHAGKEGKMIP